VLLSPGWNLHWVSFSFGWIISRHLFSGNCTFPGRLRRVFVALFPHILCMGLINLVRQSFDALPERYATSDTRVSQGPPLFKACISGRIPSHIAFPAFSALTARKTSAAAMVFSFPACASCVSDGVLMAGFEWLEILSPSAKDVHSLLSKTPFWSLMDLKQQH